MTQKKKKPYSETFQKKAFGRVTHDINLGNVLLYGIVGQEGSQKFRIPA